MQVSELNNAISALANAVETFFNVNNPENAKKAFEAKKEEIKKKLKEEKEAIEDLTEDGIITLKVEVENYKIDVLRHKKKYDSEGNEYTVIFDNEKREISVQKYAYKKNEAPMQRFDEPFIPINEENPYEIVKTFKQGYDSTKHEFCFCDENTKVDVFESVIEIITKDLLEVCKSKITIIQ